MRHACGGATRNFGAPPVTLRVPGVSPLAKIRSPCAWGASSPGDATRNFGAPPVTLRAPGISPPAKIRSSCAWGASSPGGATRNFGAPPEPRMLRPGLRACARRPGRSTDDCKHKRDDQKVVSFMFGGATRNRTGDKGFADLCLTSWLWRHISGD